MTKMTDDPIRYKLLGAFRGLAILWIVCYHLLNSVSEHYGFIIDTLVKYGYLGVPVFFVISGYGIAASTSHAVHQPHIFLMRRAKRIFPLYWWSVLIAAFVVPFFHSVSLIFKTGAFAFSLPPYSLTEWLQVITLTSIFSATSWALNTAFDPINGPVWYLAVIAQIYIYVYICLYFKRYYPVLMFVGFIVSLATLVPAVKNLLPFGLFLPYFSQFYIGFAVYSLLNGGFVPAGRSITKLSIFCLCLGVLYFVTATNKQSLEVSIALITGCIFLMAYKYDRNLENWGLVRVLFVVGAFSYSLYLLHFPLRIWGGMVAQNLFPFVGESVKPIVMMTVVIALSFICYLFFEKPSGQMNVLRGLASPINTIVSGIKLTKKTAFQK